MNPIAAFFWALGEHHGVHHHHYVVHPPHHIAKPQPKLNLPQPKSMQLTKFGSFLVVPVTSKHITTDVPSTYSQLQIQNVAGKIAYVWTPSMHRTPILPDQVVVIQYNAGPLFAQTEDNDIAILHVLVISR